MPIGREWTIKKLQHFSHSRIVYCSEKEMTIALGKDIGESYKNDIKIKNKAI